MEYKNELDDYLPIYIIYIKFHLTIYRVYNQMASNNYPNKRLLMTLQIGKLT